MPGPAAHNAALVPTPLLTQSSGSLTAGPSTAVGVFVQGPSKADIWGSTLYPPQGHAEATSDVIATPLGLVSVSSPVMDGLHDPIVLLAVALFASLGWLVALTLSVDHPRRR